VTTFFTASPALDAKLRWDPVRDFIPIGQVCRAPNFFIVPTTLPVKNVAEYVALAKAKPGTLNYSHPGMGSTGHLGFELFKRRTHQQGAGGRTGDGGRAATARHRRMRAEERAAPAVRRHHQGRCRVVGEGRQGGRHHGGLSPEQLSDRPDDYLSVSGLITARSPAPPVS